MIRCQLADSAKAPWTSTMVDRMSVAPWVAPAGRCDAGLERAASASPARARGPGRSSPAAPRRAASRSGAVVRRPALREPQRGLGDLTPAAVDRQRVAAVLHLHDLRHAAVA